MSAENADTSFETMKSSRMTTYGEVTKMGNRQNGEKRPMN